MKSTVQVSDAHIQTMLELYHLESLHPNITAQFVFQSAVVYAVNGREEEALKALLHFEKCVNGLLDAEQFKLHGDEYFDLLDEWIDRFPLGNAAPRDKSLVWQSLRESLAHPAFDGIREREEFSFFGRSDIGSEIVPSDDIGA